MKVLDPIEKAKIRFIDGIPFSEQFQDVYYSSAGAVVEKSHVFIEGNQLPARFNQLAQQQLFVIGELGFGLGVNFLLTLQQWQKSAPASARLHYISSELYPIDRAQLQQILNHFPELAVEAEQLMAVYPILTPGMHRLHFGNVTLSLYLGEAISAFEAFRVDSDLSLQKKLATFSFDCWYLDGFSPKKNEAMWADNLLALVASLSHESTTLATYSVARSVKDALARQGFNYKKQQGIGHKKHYLSATISKGFEYSDVKPLRRGPSPWQCIDKSEPTHHKQPVAIIGAGFAGCLMANKLALRGRKVYLFDKSAQIASDGSGNQTAIMHFKLSAYQSEINQFKLLCYIYALQFYQAHQDCLESQTGVIDFFSEAEFKQLQQALSAWQQDYPELFQLKEAESLSKLAGVPIEQAGIYWPKALLVSPQKLCNKLINHPNITLSLNQPIEQLEWLTESQAWQLGKQRFKQVILANGWGANQFSQADFLKLYRVSGLVSHLQPTRVSKALKATLCSKGYISPINHQGHHVVGGSYHVDNQLTEAVHQYHLDIINQYSSAFAFENNAVIGEKLGNRAKTYDYFPYIGPMPKLTEMKSRFRALALDKKRRILEPGSYHQGLYTLSGFGSHGFSMIPLAVNILDSLLHHEPLPVSQALYRHLSPARGIIRDIIKGIID